MIAKVFIQNDGCARVTLIPEPGTRIIGDPKGDVGAVAFDCQDIGQKHPTTIYLKPREAKP